ncbi:hypothetical protein AOC36_00510 [Erysipelothrix larvae]|uniref:DUF1576 domain-containing protein n=1 Tax=Erysipelothrix larvae TaxID=1514105 RepID=A0A0X8GY19_9FIRM|nr:DUF1576 domain-containing protein [Erysipelothrix larvae]AMC92527.1 hypothetical protein AOC36_00510 [Erysipelothrix larvae]
MQQRTFRFLLAVSIILVAMGFIVQPFDSITTGFLNILTSRDILVTDYFAVGGVGATLVNVGLVSIISVFLIRFSKGSFSGPALASVFLMIGFAFFGKNVLNIVPILCGTFLYSFVFKEPYKDIVHIALLATCFAPVFDEVYYLVDKSVALNFTVAFLVSMSFGFITKPVSRMVYKAHDGFNLYNVGFAAGIIGIIYVSLMKTSGYTPTTHNILYNDASDQVAIFLSILFTSFFIVSFILDKNVLSSYKLLLKETGHKDNDFVEKFGFAAVLLNMSLNGFIALFYILFIAGGTLNGPVIGSLMTVVGFSGLGKHPKNTIPLYIGVILGSISKTYSINDTSILLIALFGTALAPIAGTFGFIAGIIVAYLNSSVVLNTAAMHGNINLYNSGFSCGIVAAVTVPVFRMVSHKNEEIRNQRRLNAQEDSIL